MFITKKHISRRTLLRGMGAAVALPLLESMVPAQTPLRRTAAAPKTRLACIEMVHGSAGSTAYGTEKHLWAPEKVGSDFEFTPILKSLEPFRDYVTIISHTDLRPAEAFVPSEEGADHFRASACFLTAAKPKQTEGSDVYAGTSIDQLYAQKHGQDTPLPSIQLCIEDFDSTGACGYNYSCVYMSTISWASPTTPLPMTIDPRMVFENLFGDGATTADRAERQNDNRSILDGIIRQTSRLQRDLAPKDRNRLNDYLEGVREIERRIQNIEQYNAKNPDRELPNAPIGVPDSWEEHVKLMFDLQVLAFSAEITRVSASKLSRDTSNRVFPESGMKVPFHSMSHHGQTPTGVTEFSKLNAYHVSLLPYFLEKLKSTPDGDGNLLDHTIMLYGSPIGDSHVHAHKRVPALLAGKASRQLKGNLHIKCKEETPYANLLLTILNKLGVEQASIGDSTGLIEGL